MASIKQASSGSSKGKGKSKSTPALSKRLTTKEKKELLEHAAKHPSMSRKDMYAWVKEQFGKTISQPGISYYLGNKEKKEKILNSEFKHSDVRFSNRVGCWGDVDRHVYEFVLQAQEKLEISGSMLKEKAAKFHKILHPKGDAKKHTPEGWSDGWLGAFKKRFGIKAYRLHGEAASVDEEALEQARPALQKKVAEFYPDDVYNMDETGLFFRLQADKGLATQQLSGTKAEKLRCSIAFCCSSSGEKIMPLLIWRYEKPRDMLRVERSTLGVIYKHNKKAWMNGTVFLEWLRWFDDMMHAQNKTVLLLLDNFSAHNVTVDPEDPLRATQLHFLPPNTTSRVQPLDAGIIRAFKAHYRRLFNERLLEKFEEGVPDAGKVGIRVAIQLAVEAWAQVKTQTIVNCWRHCNIRGIREEAPDSDGMNTDSDEDSVVAVRPETSPSGEVIDQDAEGPLGESIQRLKLHNAVGIEELLNPPGENVVDEPKTEEDIVEMLKDNDEEDEPVFVEVIPDEPVSAIEALNAAKVLRQWLDETDKLSLPEVTHARQALKRVERGAYVQRGERPVVLIPHI